MARNCPGCGSNHCEAFYEVASVPASSRQLSSTRDQAISLPRGDIALEFCGACGLVFNAAFDPGLVDYAGIDGDTDIHFPTLKAFQRRLAEQLIERYTLHDKNILEIGCGQGEFLTLLCELGTNHGIDFGARDTLARPPAGIDATFRNEPFGEITATSPADLICSKGLLECVVDPRYFLGLLQHVLSMRRGTQLFLQLSNFVRTLKHLSFWDIHYPRCTYFSLGSLHRLLRTRGFTVHDIWTDFDGQYLMADAQAAANGTADPSTDELIGTSANLRSLVTRFARECRDKQAMWCEILRKAAGAGNRIAIWGAGFRTTSFLTTLAVGDEVSYVIDFGPCRQGKYMPGTGHQVLAPEAIVTMRPDIVIVTNSVFTFEIRELLAKAGCAPTLLVA